MRLHPRFRTLTRFAEGELTDRSRRRVARHLAECPACRKELSLLRSMEAWSRQAPEPQPPEGALEAILARRDGGERVILPIADPGPSAGPGRRFALLGAAAGVIGLTVGFFLLAPEASAGSSELRFDPPRPRAGASVEVEYRPTAALARYEVLRLRARLRPADAERYNRGPMQTALADLRRDEDGLYRATISLPDRVVFGTFAVEEPAGEIVDHNANRLWEILVHGPDGRPLFEALEQRKNDLMGRSWEAAYETVRVRARLYPKRVQAWSSLGVFERELLSGPALDSLRRGHERRFRRFHEELSALPSAPAEQAYWMTGYYWTGGADREELRTYWRDRLEREHPDHPAVLFGRENEIGRLHRDDPDAYLHAVEPLWQRLLAHEDRSFELEAFINNALNRAPDAEDPKWFLLWMERFRQFGRPTPEAVARRIAPVLRRPDLREEALSMLRAEIARLESNPDEYRPLTKTRLEQARANREVLGGLRVTLANGLLQEADTVAALDALERAVDTAWTPEGLRLLAETRLAIGDTAGALESFAAVAADPGTPAAFADSVSARVGRGFDPESWMQRLSAGRARMSEQVLALARPRPLGEPVSLHTPRGERRSLEALGNGRPLTLVFWSRSCPPAVRALAEIERAADWADAHGTKVLLVVDDEPDGEMRAVLQEKGVTLEPYYDDRREATRAFENFGTPMFYVLDGRGDLVFEGAGTDQIGRISRQMAALLYQREAAGQ